MKIRAQKVFKAAIFAIAIAIASITGISAQEMTNLLPGQKTEVVGYINTRDGETFKMTTPDGKKIYQVVITPDTTVKSNTKGVFRGGTKYEASYLLRGLRVEVQGAGNSDGALVAKVVRFNETDLRTAQSLETRNQPLEQRVSDSEDNAKRMSGQIEENTAIANQAKGTADEALKSAIQANNRINGLDEWESVKTITVPFATGKWAIGPQGKATIDEAAAWVKTQNTKGWMVAVVGFADSTGRTVANKTLSEKRANSVIGYLVSTHSLPLQRLIQPFGAGVDQPVATNDTSEGRAQNRRVEIRLLKNKGISNSQ